MRYHGGGYLKGILDFSTNLNPLGTPEVIKKEIIKLFNDDIYKYYPDSNYEEIRKSIAYFYDIDYKYVLQTSGASEAISLIISLLRPRKIYLIEPTFGDYELISEALGINLERLFFVENHDRFEFVLSDLKIKNGLLVICNPNNPTGSFINHDDIIEFAEKNDCYILLDEVYVELSDYETIIKRNIPENIIVVKSFTKIFSVPGLRIGFIYCKDENIINKLDNIRPIWNLNSIADKCFTNVLKKYKKELWDFINASKKYIRREREFLYNELSKYFKVYKSCANFLLLKSKIPGDYLKQELLKRNIYIRVSNYYNLSKNFIRISIKRRGENELLVKSFEEIFRNN